MVALCAVAVLSAALPQPGRAAPKGIRHQVTVALQPFASSLGGRTEATASRVDLRIFVQISDHAADSRFYGTAETLFTDVDPSTGAGEAVVWEDVRCHRERGVPKITLVRIEGAVRAGDRSYPLTALARQIGLRVPADEIIERKGFTDDHGRTLMIIDAVTKASGVAVRIRLNGEACGL